MRRAPIIGATGFSGGFKPPIALDIPRKVRPVIAPPPPGCGPGIYSERIALDLSGLLFADGACHVGFDSLASTYFILRNEDRPDQFEFEWNGTFWAHVTGGVGSVEALALTGACPDPEQSGDIGAFSAQAFCRTEGEHKGQLQVNVYMNSTAGVFVVYHAYFTELDSSKPNRLTLFGSNEGQEAGDWGTPAFWKDGDGSISAA